MMVLIYIIRYSLFVYSLYKLSIEENEKTIEKVNNYAKICGSLALKLLQVIVMSANLKSDKLQFVLEHCDVHSFEQTSSMYFKEHKRNILDDYDIVSVIGSGSIGQVYKCYCKKRKEYIAMKVKHPDINSNVNKTVFALKLVCFLLKRVNRFHYIIMEYIDNIYLQIDYIQEAENTKKLKYNFRNDECIVVPEIYEYTSNFIMMSYHNGKLYKDVSEQNKLVSSMYMNFFYMTSILIHDFLHADLHFGNWKIIEEENDIKLLIYDCGIMCSTGSLELNKRMLENTFNRRNFMKLLDIFKELDNTLKIDKYKPEIEKIIRFDISSSECLTNFLYKLIELKLLKNKNLINLLNSISIIGETPKKSVSTFTKYIYSTLETNTILYHTYVGVLSKMNKFTELKFFFINEIKENDGYKEKYSDWLYQQFGHRNGKIFDNIIYNKFFPII